MPENTFDIVSKIEMPEVSNAIQQALKEIQQRYDLKNSHSDHRAARERKQDSAGQRGRVQAQGRDRDPGAEAGET